MNKTTPAKKEREVKNVENVASETGVLLKLLAFSLLIITLPLFSYFATLHYFPQEPIKAAIVAVVSANVLLAIYVWIAYREDQQEQFKSKRE